MCQAFAPMHAFFFSRHHVCKAHFLITTTAAADADADADAATAPATVAAAVSAPAQAYLTDAVGERVWIDVDENRELVRNIETVFGPAAEHSVSTSDAFTAGRSGGISSGTDGGREEQAVAGEKSGSGGGGGGGGAGGASRGEQQLTSSPRTPDDDEGWEEEEVISIATVATTTTSAAGPAVDAAPAPPIVRVRPRWSQAAQAAAEKLVCDTTRGVLQTSVRMTQLKGSLAAPPKGLAALLRALGPAMVFQQVRVLVGKELQNWAQNLPDGSAEPLAVVLRSLPRHCGGNSKEDREVMVAVLRLRLSPTSPALPEILMAVDALLEANAQYPIVALQCVRPTSSNSHARTCATARRREGSCRTSS
jgi:hypothetical protein